MQRNRGQMAWSRTVLGLLFICCVKICAIGQVSAQNSPVALRPGHRNNNERKLESSYVLGQENFPSVQEFDLRNSNYVKLDEHKSDNGDYGRPNSNIRYHDAKDEFLRNQGDFETWIQHSIDTVGIPDKRFLDSIASDIIRRDSATSLGHSFVPDVIKSTDNSLENIDIPRHIFKGSSTTPKIYLKDHASIYQDDDTEADLDYYNEGQPYDDFQEEEGFPQNTNGELWIDNEPIYIEPQTQEHSLKLRFNDSFLQHFVNEKINDDHKRFLDTIAGEIIKKSDATRNLNTFTKQTTGKVYIDRVTDSLMSEILDSAVDSNEDHSEGSDSSNSQKGNRQGNIIKQSYNTKGKRYLDSVGSSLIKKNTKNNEANENAYNKRYLDSLASSLIKRDKTSQKKNSLTGGADKHGSSFSKTEYNKAHFVTEDDDANLENDLFLMSQAAYDNFHNGNDFTRYNINTKRYLDGIASSLIKKDDVEKRYLDGIASSLIKKNDGEKRYLDGIASSLIKKDDDEKRYLDGIASSLIKKNDGKKRYLDGIASSLIKKDDGEKRYLDGIASSLIKKDDGEKRYLDSIASSLIKKDDGEKRYLDGIASSLIKKDDGEKRYLDGIASSLIKKNDGEKRYLDGIASSLIKKDDGEKRYLDGIASSLIKKDDGEKRYLDGIASSLIKKDDGEKRYLDGIASSLIKKDDGKKRYLDGIASSLIKKDDGKKRYLDGIASSLIKKDDGKKRYLDGIASSLIKKDVDEKRYLDGIASSLIKKDDGEKRYLDGIASSLIKKDDGKKRYLDGIASSLIKKDDGEKRYLDGIASSLIKKDDGEKRYLDGIASSLIKKDDGKKRYLDGIASSLIKKDVDEKRYLDGIASSLIKKDDGEKRYLDGIASSLIKKNPGEKRYLDGIASSLIKKGDGEKRYLDGIASSLIKKNDGEKRYLDGIASSLIKRSDGKKRYLDGIASSLIKKDDGEKRYLDGIANSLIKKDDGEKRYLDGIASSLIKKDDGEKRYLDGIASSLIKKDDGEKRYLDGIASSLIKRGYDGEKRYLDGIASSLIKKDDGEKRYLDGIASSLIRRDDGKKRYLDGIASSLIKKDDGEKRYLDGIASSLIKKDDGEKRYLDGIASSLIKKDDGEKRYLDGIASLLIKKDDGEKRYLDGIASSLIKKDDGEKRYLDGIASSLIRRDDGKKRYLDGIASSLIKKDDVEKRYLDGIASSLIKMDDGEKRYLDGIASSIIKKSRHEKKRYLDGIASSLIKKRPDEKIPSLHRTPIDKTRPVKVGSPVAIEGSLQGKRYLDDLASSLIKKQSTLATYIDKNNNFLTQTDPGNKRYLDMVGSSLIKRNIEAFPFTSSAAADSKGVFKRMFEVTDDVMDGSRDDMIVKDPQVNKRGSTKYDVTDNPQSQNGKNSRRRRDISGLTAQQDGSKARMLSLQHRQKRFIDGIANNVLYKRFGFHPQALSKHYKQKNDHHRRTQTRIAERENARRSLKLKHNGRSKNGEFRQEDFSIHANKLPTPSFYKMPVSNHPQNKLDLNNKQINSESTLLDNPSSYRYVSSKYEHLGPNYVAFRTFGTVHKIDPLYAEPNQSSLLNQTPTQSYIFGQVILPPIHNSGQNSGFQTSNIKLLSRNDRDKGDRKDKKERVAPFDREIKQGFLKYDKVAFDRSSKYPKFNQVYKDKFIEHTEHVAHFDREIKQGFLKKYKVTFDKSSQDRKPNQVYKDQDTFIETTAHVANFAREINKRLETKEALTLDTILINPHINEIVADLFKTKNSFKSLYLNLATGSPVKPGEKFRAHEKSKKRNAVPKRYIHISKRFDLKTINKTNEEFNLKRVIASLKRYAEDITSSIHRSRILKENMTVLTVPRRFFEERSESTTENRINPSIISRLRSYQSQNGHATSSRTWDSPKDLTTNKAARTGPETDYQNQSLKEYVRAVTQKILSRAQFIGEKFEEGNKNDIVLNNDQQTLYGKPSNLNEHNNYSHDFFDEIAGHLLM